MNMKSTLFMTFGSLLVVGGALMLVFWPSVYFGQLRNRMVLSNTSFSFDVWKETPVPMYLECFMWNISNINEVLSGEQTRLKFVQMGPYSFRESHSKTNISFNDNSTVTFFNERFWHFAPEKSNGSLSDNITTINPIIVTVAHIMRDSPFYLRPLIDAFLRFHHRNIFLTANVSSWLFDGIDDPILDIGQEFPGVINMPYDKFGWFYDRNGSMEYDGVFVMNTGADDFSQLGNVELWNHSNRTMYRDECGAVKGSTGELWAPELGQPEVNVFASDVCTYLTLAKNETVTVRGIEGVMYAGNDSLFDNGYKYPHMACYCDEVRDSDCLPSGALNVSACRYGAPAFVSLPHFLHSDPYYPSKVDGMAPNDSHNFRLILEMITGIPLGVSAQLQINLLVRRVTGITINNQLPDPDTLVPIFWFRQEMDITDDFAAMARQALNIRQYVPYAFYSITVIGIALLIVGITVLITKLLRSDDTTPILHSTDNLNNQ